MKKLIFATGNQGKVKEFRQILGDKYEVLSLKDIGLDIEIERKNISGKCYYQSEGCYGSNRGDGTC